MRFSIAQTVRYSVKFWLETYACALVAQAHVELPSSGSDTIDPEHGILGNRSIFGIGLVFTHVMGHMLPSAVRSLKCEVTG